MKHINTEKALVSGHVQMESAKKRGGRYERLIEMIDDTQSEQFIHKVLEMLAKVKAKSGDAQETRQAISDVKQIIQELELSIGHEAF